MHIAKRIDLSSGLYPVSIKSRSKIKDAWPWYEASIRIKANHKGYAIANEILNEENGRVFVWKIVDQKAVKSTVYPTYSDGYSTLIKKGLRAGDRLIIGKTARLKEGIKVLISQEVGGKS